jgi:hypothetical protein
MGMVRGDRNHASGHPARRWQFKARFRERAFGWHGSRTAIARLKEATSEIQEHRQVGRHRCRGRRRSGQAALACSSGDRHVLGRARQLAYCSKRSSPPGCLWCVWRGSVENTCKRWSQGQLERERLGVQWHRQNIHVQDILTEASDVFTSIGAETADHAGHDGMPFRCHGRKCHSQVGDETDVFELLLLLDRIAAFDPWAADGNPVEEIVVSFDLGGFSAIVRRTSTLSDRSDAPLTGGEIRTEPTCASEPRSPRVPQTFSSIGG